MRNVPLVLQNEIAECGLACVAMISGYHGHHVDLAVLRQHFDPSTRGSTMKDLASLGESLGFGVRSLRLGPKQIDKLQLPAVLHWNLVHYVVLVDCRRGEYVIHDPAVGRRTIDEMELSRSFTGVAQEFSRRETFMKVDQRTAVPLQWLMSGWGRYSSLLATIFFMSLVMQALIMAVPLGAQIVLDRVSASRDEWALGLAVLMSGAGLGLYCVLLWLRSAVVIHLNHTLDTVGSSRLISKMLRLPYDFFARRDTGSLLTRFSNLREIRQLLSQGFAESMVEAVLAIAVLAGIALYLPAASVVAVSSLVAYGLFRVVTRQQQQDKVSEMFRALGNQSGSLIETLHKVETVKANAIEGIREQFWLSRYCEYQNSVVLKSRMDQANVIASILCFGVGYAVTAWLAVRATFASSITGGEALTIFLLLGLFFSRSIQFLERLFELLVARVHLDSLSEVVHSDTEYGQSVAVPRFEGPMTVELRDVGFRYSASEPFVFRHVSFKIQPGQCVAITGRSGCGKSTLLSLLLGLRQATEGEILVDGVPIEGIDKRALRSKIGSVLQSDRLFYGSVLENVTLFDLNAPTEKALDALELCGMADVIARLPMKEHTPLSDAPSLSGGEIQRLLLSRALYKEPGLLLLDEASSHLDDMTESIVNRSLRESGATRIMVAHRAQTIELADVVLTLGPSETRGFSTILDTRVVRHLDNVAPAVGA